MHKFEQYLINRGLSIQVAARYGCLAEQYLKWVQAEGLTARKVKRPKFLEWLKQCAENGNGERTLRTKETAMKHYYFFLGGKTNPAIGFLKRKKRVTLPPKPLSREELMSIYQSVTPKSPVEHRNRAMLGLVLFQALLRSELTELRISDIDFESCTVFVQGQRRTNSRKLSLEPFQVMHLYEYLNKYRRNFLAAKKHQDSDRFFLSQGSGRGLDNSLARLLADLKRRFPQVENLLHLRGSMISNWEKEEGIMEAMVKAGHRYVSSTQRFQGTKYEELQDQLKSLHPLEWMNLIP